MSAEHNTPNNPNNNQNNNNNTSDNNNISSYSKFLILAIASISLANRLLYPINPISTSIVQKQWLCI